MFFEPRKKQAAFAGTVAGFIPLGKGSFVVKEALENVAEQRVIKAAEKNIFRKALSGVYELETTGGNYVGQSENRLARFIQHLRPGGQLNTRTLIKDVYHEMPGSTKLEREVYEQYVITKAEEEGVKLLNKVDPMGGRMKDYYRMIDNVIKEFNLPR